jgi:hypothetical protein
LGLVWYMASMGEPRDHHFIPVFYLKRWSNAAKKVVEFSRPYKAVVAKPVGPKATGFQTDLYSFPELPEEARHILESQFFKDTDQLASDALDQLYSGSPTWTAETRTAWSRFVLNFLIRHPDPLQELRDHIKATWNRSDPYYEAKYAAARKPTDPPTLVDYAASLGSYSAENIQMRLLRSVLDNERIGQKINDMQWDVLDVSNAKYPLLTSDWPADLVLSRGMLSLPVGPKLLFVAAKDINTLHQMRIAKTDLIVELTNKYVVSKARRYVYSQDESQFKFINKYISKDKVVPPFWPSLGSTHAADLETFTKQEMSDAAQ